MEVIFKQVCRGTCSILFLIYLGRFNHHLLLSVCSLAQVQVFPICNPLLPYDPAPSLRKCPAVRHMMLRVTKCWGEVKEGMSDDHWNPLKDACFAFWLNQKHACVSLIFLIRFSKTRQKGFACLLPKVCYFWVTDFSHFVKCVINL